MPRFRQMAEIVQLMRKKEAIRNIGIVAHVDHGKTTMVDSLLVGAGLLSPQVAGPARVLDYLDEEQKRGITIKTANISLVHHVHDHSYLINLIDTPGHVDFAGKVTGALRAIDGAVVVVDAVEEIMAQTETVTRLILEERIRPTLFINKIDRLIKEMKLTPAQIESKLSKIIRDFNNLIEIYAEPDFKEKWKVDPNGESVVFGSALHRWGFTLKIADEKGVNLSNAKIRDIYRRGEHQKLSSMVPLHTAILEMVVKNLPNPIESQTYRVPKIWKGDISSEVGQAMSNCRDEGPTVMCVTKVQLPPDIGLVAAARLFSGSIEEGDEIYIVEDDKEYRVQHVFMYMGAFREAVRKITAGNIAALSGLGSAKAGNTLVDPEYKRAMVPFEQVRQVAEPVMTIVIEPKRAVDLPRIVEAMDRIVLEDPNLVTATEEETGQYLVSGTGELQLQIALDSLKQHIGEVELTVSSPTAAYRETILRQSKIVMAKSQNKRNEFWVQTEPIEAKDARLTYESQSQRATDKDRNVSLSWKEEDVWASDENKNVLVDVTSNVQNLQDVKDSIVAGFYWACKRGPLCEEPLRGIMAKLVAVHLDESPAERDPTQVMRAVTRAILGSMLTASPVLLEPVFRIEITVPTEWFGACSSVVTRRRGKIQAVEQKGPLTIVKGSIPVSETFGLTDEMRSTTSGHAFWQLAFDRWEKTPERLATETISRIRKKRGLSPQIPKPETFVDETQPASA
jgi:elongation factor 2